MYAEAQLTATQKASAYFSVPGFSEFEADELGYKKGLLEDSLFWFSRFALKQRTGVRFVLGRHHKLVCDTLEKVFKGEIRRLLINIPPGYSKTELAVVDFISWCLAKKPQSRFIHVSSLDGLVLENSSSTRKTIQSEGFQTFWPLKLQADSKSKRKWYVDEYDGGMYSVPTNGAVTGFRAGRIGFKGFSGALIFDDPLKPVDANHVIKRKAVNDQYNETVRSRIAHENVPVIVIMQRVHNEDLSHFLLTGGSGEKWHHLELPVEIRDDYEYPIEYTYGIPIRHNLAPGPLWDYKHNMAQINGLRMNPKTKYVFDAQYMQRPSSKGGTLFQPNWWSYYGEYDAAQSRVYLESGRVIQLLYKSIYADTAQKTKNYHDYSVFQLWGKGDDGRIYLLDQLRARLEAPDLEKQAIRFVRKHQYRAHVNSMGVRSIKVEDKSSGTGLIQTLKRKGFNIDGIPRNIDKVSRATDGAPRIAEGEVVLPNSAYWLPDYVKEFADFSPLMSHAHDDQIDATLDAVQDMLTSTNEIDYDRFINNETETSYEGIDDDFEFDENVEILGLEIPIDYEKLYRSDESDDDDIEIEGLAA
jgi:predicted phage terminase large subunit-like protein